MTTRPPLSPVAKSSPSWLNSTQDMISASVTSSSKAPLICEKHQDASPLPVNTNDKPKLYKMFLISFPPFAIFKSYSLTACYIWFPLAQQLNRQSICPACECLCSLLPALQSLRTTMTSMRSLQRLCQSLSSSLLMTQLATYICTLSITCLCFK